MGGCIIDGRWVTIPDVLTEAEHDALGAPLDRATRWAPARLGWPGRNLLAGLECAIAERRDRRGWSDHASTEVEPPDRCGRRIGACPGADDLLGAGALRHARRGTWR